MHRGRASGGYTIVEVMMFLAVSSFMFVIAAYFIQGKQATAQFKQAMNSINSEASQVINNVNDDNYPPVNMRCQPSGQSSNPLSITSASNEQGSNLGCVFLGEVMQFGVNGTNGQGYNVYTVAGCQYIESSSCSTDFINGVSPKDFSDAFATVIDPEPATKCANTGSITDINVNLTECNTLDWGIYATNMYDYQGANKITKTNSVGFFTSFAAQDSQGLLSGSQNLNVIDPASGAGIDISNSGTNKDESHMVPIINTYLSSNSSPYIPNPFFVVCFSDGRGHAGALTIGGGDSSGSTGQRLSTSIAISNTTIFPFGQNGNPRNYSCSP